MEKAEIIDHLKKHRIFALLGTTELKTIADISICRKVEVNEEVISKDQLSGNLFLVTSGRLSLRIQMREIREFFPGELFGEIGLFADHKRSGTVIAEVESRLIEICADKLFDENHVKPAIALKLTRALTRKITDYLRRREQLTTRSLIHEGENEYVEFKSSLRFNVHSGKKDHRLQMTVIKSIAAFLNSKGGTLLVGIQDDGSTLGLKAEGFANNDKLMLTVNNLLKAHIGTLHLSYISPSIVIADGVEVLRIDIEPANEPAYVTDGNDQFFYIRTGPSTTNLALRNVYDYIRKRFHRV